MSHGAHSGHDISDRDLPPLPASADIAWGVRLLVLATILTSIMQGSFVVGSSHEMHVWPAADSVKVELPPFNPNP